MADRATVHPPTNRRKSKRFRTPGILVHIRPTGGSPTDGKLLVVSDAQVDIECTPLYQIDGIIDLEAGPETRIQKKYNVLNTRAYTTVLAVTPPFTAHELEQLTRDPWENVPAMIALSSRVSAGQISPSSNVSPGPADPVRPEVPRQQNIKHMILRDLDEVAREIQGIQACRATIFMGTLGAIAAAAVSVGVGWLRLDVQGVPRWDWIFFSSLLALGMLTIGILVSIEKGRAINWRNGFMGAVVGLLQKGEAETPYLGWAIYRHCLPECGTRRRLRTCNYPPPSDSCKDLGLDDAHPLLKRKRPLPAVLDSFTSLSTFTFGTFYLLAAGCVAYSMVGWQAGSPEERSVKLLWAAIGLAVGAVLFMSTWLLDAAQRAVGRGRLTLTLRLAITAACICVVILIALEGMVEYGTRGVPDLDASDQTARGAWTSISALCILWLGAFILGRLRLSQRVRFGYLRIPTLVALGGYLVSLALLVLLVSPRSLANPFWEGCIAGAVGLAVAWFGVYLGNQIYELGKGKHSLETYYYTWSHIIRRCLPLPDPVRLQAAHNALVEEQKNRGRLLSAVRRFFRSEPRPPSQSAT